MGFCLFEDADFPGSFLAINSNHVQDVLLEENGAASAVQFTAPLLQAEDEIKLRLVGEPDAIWQLLSQAAKIGLGKAKLNLMTNLSAQPMPLLINRPDRIMLVRELQPEEFMDEESSLITASRLFFVDGKNRFVSERPGVFVSLTNAGRNTPILKEKGQAE